MALPICPSYSPKPCEIVTIGIERRGAGCNQFLLRGDSPGSVRFSGCFAAGTRKRRWPRSTGDFCVRSFRGTPGVGETCLRRTVHGTDR